MPLSTRPFFTDNPGSIPYEYVVPATVELRVQSIVARFDGGGASGEFYPCLAIYTQDNHLLARIRTDQKFAIGDSGVVTWGPFLRQAAAAAAPPPPPAGATIYWLEGTGGPITSGAGMTAIVWTDVSAFNDGTYLDYTAGGDPRVLGAGIYLWSLICQPTFQNPNVDTTMQLDWNVSSGSGGNWSSRVPGGLEAFASWAWRINSLGTPPDVNAEGQSSLLGIAGWATTATFPGVVRVRVDVLENNVSVARQTVARLAVVRIGTGFE
jgi:hypothetical protein